MALFKRAARKLSHEAQSFLSELNRLVTKVRYLNANYVPDRREDATVCVVLNSNRIDVPLEWFEYLPEILASYGQYVERMVAMSNVQTMDDHGPELTMLATYLRVKAGRPCYKDLIFLLDDAYNCVGLQFELDLEDREEAIRKALARYRKNHPKTCIAIRESISNYETLPLAFRRVSLVAHIRSDLSHPRLMMDQYHKSGKRSHTKRAD